MVKTKDIAIICLVALVVCLYFWQNRRHSLILENLQQEYWKRLNLNSKFHEEECQSWRRIGRIEFIEEIHKIKNFIKEYSSEDDELRELIQKVLEVFHTLEMKKM